MREGKRPGWEHGCYELMREKLATDRGRKLYGQRKITIEPVYGQIKHNRGYRPASCEEAAPPCVRVSLLCQANLASCGFRLGEASHRGGGFDGGVDSASRCWAVGDRVVVRARGGLCRECEEVMEAACEVPLEAPQCALVGLPFGLFAFEERLGGGVDAGAGDGDDVQRPVELAVTAAVQAVLAVLPGGARDRSDPGLQREARVALELFGASGSADQDRGNERSAAGLFEQPRALRLDQLEQLLLDRVDFTGQPADVGQQPTCDPCPDAVGQPAESSVGAVDLAHV